MLREILQSIKEIIVDYVKSRLFPVTVVVLVLFSILVHQLFVLQIKEGEEHMENFVYKSKKTLNDRFRAWKYLRLQWKPARLQ